MEKRDNTVTFLQAYLISIGAMNKIVGILLNRSSGVTFINLIPICAIMVIHFFTSNKKRDLNLNKKAMLFVYYILSVIVVYMYAFRYTTVETKELFVYILIPIYLSLYKVDAEKLLKYIMFFSILVLPVSGEFFSVRTNDTISMGTTYSALPFAVSTIIHFWYYRKNAGFFTWICYLVNIYYAVMIVMLGNRGPLVSFIVLGILLLLNKFSQEDIKKKSTTRTMVIIIIVGILIIYTINNFEMILYALNGFLNSKGIKISSLSKSIGLTKAGNLANGRNSVFDFAINGIKEHYLLGNGITSIYYRSFYSIPYPHNLFLQMWYDLGIVVSIPLLWILLKSGITVLFKSNIVKAYAIVMILLVSITIPKLCYSGEFWTDIPFWFLIMYTISPNIYGKYRLGDEANGSEFNSSIHHM